MSEMVWIPAVPEPRTTCCKIVCECGERFRKIHRKTYEIHWRREHEADLPAEHPQMEVTRAEADAIYARVRMNQPNGGHDAT